LHRKSEKPAVFLAGGIGITPFVSMIRQAGHDQSPHHMYLFYSNRRPEDAAFLDLLSEATKRNPNFRLIATMTEMDKSHREWKGEIGSVNKDMLTKHLPSLQGPTYYLAGPPAMVATMQRMLIEAEVDEDDIRTDEFYGY
jgi:ferredoxin-NADP reductase